MVYRSVLHVLFNVDIIYFHFVILFNFSIRISKRNLEVEKNLKFIKWWILIYYAVDQFFFVVHACIFIHYEWNILRDETYKMCVPQKCSSNKQISWTLGLLPHRSDWTLFIILNVTGFFFLYVFCSYLLMFDQSHTLFCVNF